MSGAQFFPYDDAAVVTQFIKDHPRLYAYSTMVEVFGKPYRAPIRDRILAVKQ